MIIRKSIAVLSIAILSLPFHSCKKGAEDPFLSVRSRDNRITGTWLLKEANSSFVSSDLSIFLLWSNTPTTSSMTSLGISVFENGELVITNSTDMSSNGTDSETRNVLTSNYSMTLDILNDGTYTISENYGYTSETMTTYTKQGDVTTTTRTDTTYNPEEQFLNTIERGYWTWEDSKKDKSFINLSGIGSFHILRLAHKELKLEEETNSYTTDQTGVSFFNNDSRSGTSLRFEKDL